MILALLVVFYFSNDYKGTISYTGNCHQTVLRGVCLCVCVCASPRFGDVPLEALAVVVFYFSNYQHAVAQSVRLLRRPVCEGKKYVGTEDLWTKVLTVELGCAT